LPLDAKAVLTGRDRAADVQVPANGTDPTTIQRDPHRDVTHFEQWPSKKFNYANMRFIGFSRAFSFGCCRSNLELNIVRATRGLKARYIFGRSAARIREQQKIHENEGPYRDGCHTGLSQSIRVDIFDSFRDVPVFKAIGRAVGEPDPGFI